MVFNYKFYTSLRYEIFYAIQLLTDDSSKVHSEWKEKTIIKLSKPFHEKLKYFGLKGAVWTILADILEGTALAYSFDDIMKAIREIPATSLQKNFLLGAIHYSDIVEKIINKEIDIEIAIKKIPKEKYEWLAYIGLYPYNKEAPINVAIELLINNVEMFRNLIIELLTEFWTSSFEETWKNIFPKLSETTIEKNRLYDICTLREFSKNALIPIEVDEKKKKITALRGGYAVQFVNIEKLVFLPSVFNYKRLWSAYKTNYNKVIACFPFFEPKISLNNINICYKENEVYNALDPALIFKALGDVTRFTIITVIAKESKTSVELSKALLLTKATVSHHVHILREAGLINESYQGGAVKLSLKKEVIENLSNITIEQLYKKH